MSQISLFRKIAHKIARTLLADEVAKVDLERQSFLQMQEKLNEQIKMFTVEAPTIEGATRKMLHGFDPKLLENDKDILESLPDDIGEDVFLLKAKLLKENPVFDILLNYLIREQILYTVKEAPTLETLNFGRATINGLSLFREEVERLAGLYAKRHAAEPEFDEHEVL